MATYLGKSLPEDLWERLREGNLYRQGGLGVGVLSVDQNGWPHVAVVSCAVAIRPDRILFPIGGLSNSLQHIVRDGKCTLLVAAPGLLAYVKGRAAPVRSQLVSVPQEAAVGLDVTGVWLDAGRIFALTGGLTYRFVREPEECAQLEESIRAELAAMEA